MPANFLFLIFFGDRGLWYGKGVRARHREPGSASSLLEYSDWPFNPSSTPPASRQARPAGTRPIPHFQYDRRSPGHHGPHPTNRYIPRLASLTRKQIDHHGLPTPNPNRNRNRNRKHNRNRKRNHNPNHNYNRDPRVAAAACNGRSPPVTRTTGSKTRAERAAEPGFRLDPNGIVRIEPTTMGLAT